MRCSTVCGSIGLMLFLIVAVMGCRQDRAAQPKAGSENAATVDPAEAEINAALAQLPEQDQAAARRQRICPVSGEPLGSMGTPIKVRLQEREVFICCAGCEEPLRSEPQKYLGRLEQQENTQL